MKDFKLTGAETGPQLVQQLIALRLMARTVLAARETSRATRQAWESIRDRNPGTPYATEASNGIQRIDESLLQAKFMLIEIGNYLMPLCAHLDLKAPRAMVLDALEVNVAQRDTEDMRKYGDKTIHIIGALALENSATKDTNILTKPLQWCQTMAFNHALQTNEKLDRTVHDEANKMFDGAFGEYRERPLMERLAGQGGVTR